MTIEERNEILRSRLQLATQRGFVIKPHHYMGRDKNTGEMFGYESIIFDHDFAKALWGEEVATYCIGEATGSDIHPIMNQVGIYYRIELWQYHVQEMAVAPDRLAYLKANTHEQAD